MSKKGGYVIRVNPRTQIAINMLAAELQLETGRNVSADAALWTVIEQFRPDLAQKADVRAKEMDEDESLVDMQDKLR